MITLAALSVLASEIPAVAAWPLAAATLGYGVWLILREWRQPSVEFLLGAQGSRTLVDGVPVNELEVRWRGPFAFVCWRDAGGRMQRRAWWPDTLPAAHRRELRLAAPAQGTAPKGSSMAP